MSVLTIRAHKRYAVRQPVRLADENGSSAHGLLIELSCEGLRISNLGRTPFSVGDPVSVDVGHHSLRGRIRWAHDGIAGVRLDAALHTQQLGNLIALGRGELAEDVRRYGT
jgi:hypothetical protein